MRNSEPIHFCSGGWKHRDDDCHCPCSFCHIYSQRPVPGGGDTVFGVPSRHGRENFPPASGTDTPLVASGTGNESDSSRSADCVSVVCAHCGGDVKHLPPADAVRHHGHVIDSPECWDKCGDPDVESIKGAAEYLAYQIWEYDWPNEGAVANALLSLHKARRAFEAAGFSLLLNDGCQSQDNEA